MEITRDNFENWWFNRHGYSNWSRNYINKISKCLKCDYCAIENHDAVCTAVCTYKRHKVVCHDSSPNLHCSISCRSCPLLTQNDKDEIKLKKLKKSLDIHEQKLKKEQEIIEKLKKNIAEMED